MLVLGKTGRARASAKADSARSRDSYHYYALTLYRQALLAPDDSVRGEDDARYRLAESVFRRCYKLVATSGQQDRRPGLWAGIKASAVLGIQQRDMAVFLRTVMRSPTTSSAAAVQDGDQPGDGAAGRQ
jgi:hypothetical protein